MPRYDNELDGLSLLMDGLVGKSDGSIERMEAQGQQALVASADLPLDMGNVTREEVTEHTGIVFGEPVNDLFVSVTLPEGWEKRATDHSMHSNLVDDKGRTRGGIFYKAAFYDRSANLHFRRFYTAENRWTGAGSDGAEVKNADGNVLKFFPPLEDEKSWDNQARAQAWLDEQYPDNNSVWAYWSA